jgi:phytoene/squalene synthetase
LFALYGYNLEAARAPWKVSDPQIGVMRLRFLLDMAEGAYQGQSPLAHEIGEPIHSLITDTKPPQALMTQIVETRMRDLDPAPMESAEAFDAYVDGTAGALMRLAVHVCLAGAAPHDAAVETDSVAALAGEVGRAQGVAMMLAASVELAARGRAMLPGAAGRTLDPEPLARGETTAEWREAAAQVAAPALARLKAARARSGEIPAGASPALLAAWRAERILKAALRPSLDMLRDLGPESPFRRRASLLARGLTGRW